MRRHASCWTLLFLLVTAIAVRPARAQDPGDGTVPVELVRVLSGGAGAPPGGVDVRVGRLPEALARMLPLPEGARVVGSVAFPGHTRAAIAVPVESDVVLEQWPQRLIEAGWTRQERPSRGGFESNAYPGRALCMGDSAGVHLLAFDDPEGGSYVVVDYSTVDGYPPCAAPQRPDPWQGQSLIPVLHTPRGAAVDGGRASGGDDEWSSRARVRADLTAEELAEHYGTQLRADGWTPVSTVSSADLAARTYRVTDGDGDAWHGVLLVHGPPEGLGRFLSVEVRRLGPPH